MHPARRRSARLGSPVHVAPACVGSGEGNDHFGAYVRSLSLHFCNRLFPGFEPMTSWSQGNRFTAVPGLPFVFIAVQGSTEEKKIRWVASN
jgi:hypothetical protein